MTSGGNGPDPIEYCGRCEFPVGVCTCNPKAKAKERPSDRQYLPKWMRWMPVWMLMIIIIFVFIPIHIIAGMIDGISDGIAELRMARDIDK